MKIEAVIVEKTAPDAPIIPSLVPKHYKPELKIPDSK